MIIGFKNGSVIQVIDSTDGVRSKRGEEQIQRMAEDMAQIIHEDMLQYARDKYGSIIDDIKITSYGLCSKCKTEDIINRIDDLEDMIYMQECYLSAKSHDDIAKAIIQTTIKDMEEELSFLRNLITE